MDMNKNSIFDKRVERYKLRCINNAVHKGIYVGSPGKDIYMILPFLSLSQLEEVAIKFSQQFPRTSIKKNVNVAACIRFIYGQFEKQGILRSKNDFERMKNEKINWDLPRKFLKLVYKELYKSNNYYGLTILCEIEGHRLGDEAVINEDKNKLSEMENKYNKCVKFAHKCKSCKHMFTPYYWASRYFVKFGDVDKAVEYAKLAIQNGIKYYREYWPNGDTYYSKRLKVVFSYIKTNDKEYGREFKKKYKNEVKEIFRLRLKNR